MCYCRLMSLIMVAFLKVESSQNGAYLDLFFEKWCRRSTYAFINHFVLKRLSRLISRLCFEFGWLPKQTVFSYIISKKAFNLFRFDSTLFMFATFSLTIPFNVRNRGYFLWIPHTIFEIEFLHYVKISNFSKKHCL